MSSALYFSNVFAKGITIHRAGTSAQDMVVKKYPDTTHAKSIEYRVLSEAELTSLYGSARTAWESGRGRQFTGKGTSKTER